VTLNAMSQVSGVLYEVPWQALPKTHHCGPESSQEDTLPAVRRFRLGDKSVRLLLVANLCLPPPTPFKIGYVVGDTHPIVPWDEPAVEWVKRKAHTALIN